MQRPCYMGNPVFRQYDNPASPVTEEIYQPAAEVVNLGKVFFYIAFRSDFLEDIIEMRQINKMKGRPEHLLDGHCRLAYPLTGKNGSGRSPEMKKRELPKFLIEFVPHLRRNGVTVGKLYPVGAVHGPRRCRPVNISCHVIPPERICAGKRRVAPSCDMPYLLGLHQPVS